MLFVITALDRADAGDLRSTVRTKHLDYIAKTGNVKVAGPFLDANGKMVGSLLVIEANTLQAAKDWAANDPYQIAGLFASSELRPWKATVNNCGAKF